MIFLIKVSTDSMAWSFISSFFVCLDLGFTNMGTCSAVSYLKGLWCSTNCNCTCCTRHISWIYGYKDSSLYNWQVFLHLFLSHMWLWIPTIQLQIFKLTELYIEPHGRCNFFSCSCPILDVKLSLMYCKSHLFVLFSKRGLLDGT